MKNSSNQLLLQMFLLFPSKCWFEHCYVLRSAGSHRRGCPLAARLCLGTFICALGPGAEVDGPGVAICIRRSGWCDLAQEQARPTWPRVSGGRATARRSSLWFPISSAQPFCKLLPVSALPASLKEVILTAGMNPIVQRLSLPLPE